MRDALHCRVQSLQRISSYIRTRATDREKKSKQIKKETPKEYKPDKDPTLKSIYKNYIKKQLKKKCRNLQ